MFSHFQMRSTFFLFLFNWLRFFIINFKGENYIYILYITKKNCYQMMENLNLKTYQTQMLLDNDSLFPTCLKKIAD